MPNAYDGPGRRKHLRIRKNFNLSFYLKDSPDKKSDETLIKDISRAGLRFTCSHPIEAGTRLVMGIGIPHIAPKRLILEGLVVSSKAIAPGGWVYEIRAKFVSTDNQASQLFDMIEKQKTKG